MKNYQSLITPDLIDKSKAIEVLVKKVGRDNCPYCQHGVSSGYLKGHICRCRRCGKKYTWRTGTIFEHTKLSAPQIVLILDKLHSDTSNRSIANLIGVSADTVKVWRYKISLLDLDKNQDRDNA